MLQNSRGTTLVPAGLRQAPPLRGQSSNADHNPRAWDNVWQVRLSYLHTPLSDRSSGRIFSPFHCPGSHHSRGRWQVLPGLLVSINAFLEQISENYAIDGGIGQSGRQELTHLPR